MWWESLSPSCHMYHAVSVHFSCAFYSTLCEKQETKITYILNMFISALLDLELINSLPGVTSLNLVDWWSGSCASQKEVKSSFQQPWHDLWCLQLFLWAWVSVEAGLVLHLQDPKENMDKNIDLHFCLSFQFNLTPCLTFYISLLHFTIAG